MQNFPVDPPFKLTFDPVQSATKDGQSVQGREQGYPSLQLREEVGGETLAIIFTSEDFFLRFVR